MSLKSFVLVVSLLASATALHTPRHVPHHRALARAHTVAPVQPVTNTPAIRRRADGKRCRARPSSSSSSSSSSVAATLSSVVTSSSVAIPSSSSSSPLNLVPTVPTTTNVPPPPTTDAPPPPPPTTTSAPPPPPTTSKAPPPPPPAPTTTSSPPPPPPPPPAPTTSKAPPPPPPAPTTTSAPPPPPPAPTKPPGGGGNLPSFLVGVQTGQGTFYDTGLGACGIVNKDTDYIAAASHLLFDSFPGYNGQNPNNNPMCGRKVRASYQGNTVVVALTDRCEGCALLDLDFSPSAFSELASFSVGRLSGMKWEWL